MTPNGRVEQGKGFTEKPMKLKMSPLIDNAAGKDGSLVIRRSRSGPVATPRTYPKQTASARKSAANKNLGQSASEFSNLTDAQIAAWNAYGAGRTKTNEVNGDKYAQTGFNAYVELATVFKMASPTTASPVLPPSSSYSGDSLGFSIGVTTSNLVVTSSGPVSSGTVIEISVAPLRSRACKLPKTGYVSQGFFTPKAEDGYDMVVPLPAGIHAVSVRYVRKATGQATPAQILGKGTVALSIVDGGVDGETGEVLEPVAKPRLKKAA